MFLFIRLRDKFGTFAQILTKITKITSCLVLVSFRTSRDDWILKIGRMRRCFPQTQTLNVWYIYLHEWSISMVNVKCIGKYTIHWVFGKVFSKKIKKFFEWTTVLRSTCFFFYLHLWNWLGFRGTPPPTVNLIFLLVKIGLLPPFQERDCLSTIPILGAKMLVSGMIKFQSFRSPFWDICPLAPDPPGFHFEHNVGVVGFGDVDNLRNDRKPHDLCDIPGGVGFLSSSAVMWIGRWQDDSTYM